MGKPQGRATYDDILRLPDHVVGEIIDGELIVSPRPAPPHANATSGIGGQIWGPFHRAKGGSGGPGGWWILDEPELHLRADVIVPDLAGWRRERLPKLPSTPAFELAPDWACEVISPSSAKYDRTKKMHVYAREKVEYLWFVDPLAKTLEVFRLDDQGWRLLASHGDEEKIVRAEPFAAIELDLERLWGEPSEP